MVHLVANFMNALEFLCVCVQLGRGRHFISRKLFKSVILCSCHSFIHFHFLSSKTIKNGSKFEKKFKALVTWFLAFTRSCRLRIVCEFTQCVCEHTMWNHHLFNIGNFASWLFLMFCRDEMTTLIFCSSCSLWINAKLSFGYTDICNALVLILSLCSYSILFYFFARWELPKLTSF